MPNSHHLELKGIAKSFGACVANSDVSLSVRRGTIHAIVGENGAGKSTAMKILYGMIVPDNGEIILNGQRCEWSNPRDAIRAGIGMVHQHFMLADTHTVLENILLGLERVPFWPYERRTAHVRLQEIMKKYGLEVDLDALVSSLSVGLEQRVEILKLLFRNSELLILDEPTAVLSPQEIHNLFACLRSLTSEGKTILVITHKLKEVLRYTDEVTVFRAGRVVGQRESKKTSADELAELMVGRRIHSAEGERCQLSAGAKPALEINDLSYRELGSNHDSLQNISLSAHEGEILGIAGIEGNGQSELMQALLLPQAGKRTGMIKFFAQDTASLAAGDLRSLGVGVFAEDRLHEAMLLEANLRQNLLLGYQRRADFQNYGILHADTINSYVERSLKEFDVRPADAEAIADDLSGGNQQKLVVARELYWQPKLLLAAQPTRGVDVLATQFIHEKILKLREQGAAVLLLSSELDELMKLSDRILVMFDGKLVAEFARAEFDEQRIGLAMGGGMA